MSLSWQVFVGRHCVGMRAEAVSCIVGQPAEAITRARNSMRAGTRKRASMRQFAALFAHWNGRPPEDAEWPAPGLAGAGHAYEWLGPEDALLASLVGSMDKAAIARILTARLRTLTGDRQAARSPLQVQLRINRLGMLSTDVLGGIRVPDAGREIGTVETVRTAIRNGSLAAHKIGRNLVIRHADWAAWKASRRLPPKGYVVLARLKEPLGIHSDKLSEFARMGFIPTAVQCNPATLGQHSTRWGLWYVDPAVARRLVRDRRAGGPMPWHGRDVGNNRNTFQLWQARKHPADCKTCATIWGKPGAPRTLEAFLQQYPPLDRGAKRHLTRKWTSGMSIADVARRAGKRPDQVSKAIASGLLRAKKISPRRWSVTRSDAARWIARRCPVGRGAASWITYRAAKLWYGFTSRELHAFVRQGELRQRLVKAPSGRRVPQLARQQLVQLREDTGFTEVQAARRLKVTVAQLRTLLKGVNWRQAPRIPLVTVQAVKKRMDSANGYTLAQAAKEVGRPLAWVRARVADGTVRVARTPWDARRLYISRPMLERLRKAKRRRQATKISDAWLTRRAAAFLAGVSDTTVHRWAELGLITSRPSPQGLVFSRRSVRGQTRRYWRTARFKRDGRPAWLRAESARP